MTVRLRLLLCYLTILVLLPLQLESAKPAIIIADQPKDLPLISIEWGVLSNYDRESSGATSELLLVNQGSLPLANSGWTLYFNCSCGFAGGIEEQGMLFTHLKGDFYKLEPAHGFEPLSSGQKVRITLKARGAVINNSMAPAGFYFEFRGPGGSASRLLSVKNVQVKPFVNAEQLNRDRGDLVPEDTAELRYLRNTEVHELPPDQIGRVVPTPSEIFNGAGAVTLGPSTEIRYGLGLAKEADFAAASLSSVLNAKPRVIKGKQVGASAIVLAIGRPCSKHASCSSAEAYRVKVEAGQGVTIVGNSAAAVFHGIQTLRALLPIQSYGQPQVAIVLQAMTIVDWPRFSYRGVHLDVARNFQTKQSVLKLLDLMAFYKFNTLELHLADDEGWRLEIPELPELTGVGAKRGHTTDELDHLVPSFGSGPDADATTSTGNGFYTTADFIQILQYARERHIKVIPEIESIGHARAAIKSMQSRYSKLLAEHQPDKASEYLLSDLNDQSTYESVQGWRDNVVNVCSDSTYRFFDKVMDEIVHMYKTAAAPISVVHIGGDEVPQGAWLGAPSCQDQLRAAKSKTASAVLRTRFIEKLVRLLESKGLSTAAWEEAALQDSVRSGVMEKEAIRGSLRGHLLVYAWDNVWGDGNQENAYKLANAGYKVVLGSASNLYFDLAYAKDSQETGNYWAGFVSLRKPYEFSPSNLYACARTDLMGNPINPNILFKNSVRLSEVGKRHIAGIQGHLWGETAKGQDLMEYMMFPRLLALAERSWAKQPVWEAMPAGAQRDASLHQDWNEFVNRLGVRELPRLSFLQGGVNYRLAPPGAIVSKGMLQANTEIPGEEIRYTTDNSDPTIHSRRFDGPISVSGIVKLRTFDDRGRVSQVAIVQSNH